MRDSRVAPTVINIRSEIGLKGTPAQELVAEIRAAPTGIEVRINSEGGDFFDALAIHNALLEHEGIVSVMIEGLAAGAASFIAQAASPGLLEMAPGSTMMICECTASFMGSHVEMLHLVNDLDRASDRIAEIYTKRGGRTASYWRDLMRKETWLTAMEAVDIGLADYAQDGPPVSGEDQK